MCIAFDTWEELYGDDTEKEFVESGHHEAEHEEFVEQRYFAFIDAQQASELSWGDRDQLGSGSQQDEREVLELPADPLCS